MILQGAVANISPQRATGNQNFLQLLLQDLAVSEVQPRYAALAQAGMLFTARAALQATSVAGVALVGLQLWNRNVGKNLILTKVGGNIVATSATETGLALAVGTQGTAAPTVQTPASAVVNNLVGGPAPGALALNAGTFAVAPTTILDLLHNTAAIASTGEDPGFEIDLEGSYVIPPGGYVAIVALGAAGAASSNNLWLQFAETPV